MIYIVLLEEKIRKNTNDVWYDQYIINISHQYPMIPNFVKLIKECIELFKPWCLIHNLERSDIKNIYPFFTQFIMLTIIDILKKYKENPKKHHIFVFYSFDTPLFLETDNNIYYTINAILEKNGIKNLLKRKRLKIKSYKQIQYEKQLEVLIKK